MVCFEEYMSYRQNAEGSVWHGVSTNHDNQFPFLFPLKMKSALRYDRGASENHGDTNGRQGLSQEACILPQICDSFFFSGDTTIKKVTVEIKGVFPIRGRHQFVCKSDPQTLFKEFHPQSNGRGLTQL